MSDDENNKSPPGEVYFRLFNEIGIINQLASNRAERAMPHGLTMSQFTVLNHFSRGLPPKPPLELANAFQVTKGAMTNTLKQLEGKGFVDYKAYGKSHQYFPIITKAGYRKFAFKQLISSYFDGSYEKVVSFMVSDEDNNLDEKEAQELKKLTEVLKKKK